MGLDPHRQNPHIWGIAAGLAGSILSNFISNEMNKDTTNSINDKMIGNQWQMFRAQNERQDYLNENQDLIKRNSLKKAGMNIYSEFGGYPNLNTNAVSQPQLGIPSQSFDGATIANLLQQQPLIEAQVKNINADTQKKQAETKNTEMDTVLKNTQNWRLQVLTPEEKKNIHEQSELFKQEAEKARVSVPFINKQIEMCQSEISKLDVETSWLLDSYDSRLAQSTMQVAVLQSQRALNLANAALAYKSLQVMATQMRLMESEISLNGQKWMELNTLVGNLAIDGNFKQFEYELRKRYGDTEAQKMLEFLNEKTLMIRSEQQWRPLSILLGFGNMGMNMLGTVK